jgi:hypothetical protein
MRGIIKRIIEQQAHELRMGAAMFGITDDVDIIRLLIAAVEIRKRP